MPDLRINAAANGLSIVNGQINTANVSKEQAESLIAQISASLIKRDGTARSGYLKVHAEQNGELRFSTGHFSKGAKASAAKLMHELAIKAWDESSVDTKALENYLRAPDRREGQNIALNARKAGTISLLKLVSNRYDAYNSNDQAHTLTTEGRRVTNSNAKLLFAGRKDNAVSQLQAYADRYLRGEQGGRLIIDSSAGRTNEIKKMANDSAAAVAREKAAIAAAARERLDKAIDTVIDIGIQNYANSNGITATEQNRDELNEKRLAAVRDIEKKALINAKSVEYSRIGGNLTVVSQGGDRFNLTDAATNAGLPLGSWTPSAAWRGKVESTDAQVRVLFSDVENALRNRDNGNDPDDKLAAFAAMQTSCRQDVLAGSARIESLANSYREKFSEKQPTPNDPPSFGPSTTAGIALGEIVSFSKKQEGFWKPLLAGQDMPRPLDYALIGVKGVDGLNFAAVNRAVAALGEHLKLDGDPHPAKLIQDAVNEVNRRLMGRESV